MTRHDCSANPVSASERSRPSSRARREPRLAGRLAPRRRGERFSSRCRWPGPQAGRVDADRHPRLSIGRVRPAGRGVPDCRGSDGRFPRDQRSPRPPTAASALTEGVELAGRDRDARQPAGRAHGSIRDGPGRACCSAASTSWWPSTASCCGRTCGRAVDPGSTSSPRCRRPAGRGGTLLYVPAGRGHRAAAARPLGPRAGRRRSGPHAWWCWKRAPRPRCWPRPPAATPPPPACTAARSNCSSGPAPRLRYVNLQNWGTGVWHFAHQKGPGRPRRRAAMDHRRPGQPPGQGQPARGPGRPGRRRPGQRRDVHRRQAAPLLPHAPAPPGRPAATATCSTRGPCRTTRGSSGGA